MGVDASDRFLSKRVRLNRRILENPYWFLPVDDKGHENFMPVGRGVPSSDWCGKHRGLLVCKNVDGHKGAVFQGSDCTNKVFVRNQHYWCKRSSCPVCFLNGWSVRGAKFITGRLNEAVKRGLGEVEHIVVSLPKSDYGLSHGVIRGNAVRVLKSRGVAGGGMIFHGFRIDSKRHVLGWSPHFHVLGFIRGGYGCRDCGRKWNCLEGCGGFDDRSYQEFLKDGYYVKVMDKRKTVFGTAWYQLNHATIRLGIKRFHVVTWFGICGYRNFKGTKQFSEIPCPVCGEGMGKGLHIGKRRIVKDLGHPRYVSAFLDDELDESGNPNYVE